MHSPCGKITEFACTTEYKINRLTNSVSMECGKNWIVFCGILTILASTLNSVTSPTCFVSVELILLNINVIYCLVPLTRVTKGE